MPTQKDIARRLGVSQSVVSAVLAGRVGSIGASAQLQERIRAAAARLGYQPDGSARAMRTGRFLSLGYFTANVSEASAFDWPEFRAGVYDSAAEQGYQLTTVRLPARPVPGSNPVPKVFREAHLDGLIINHVSRLTEEVRALVAESQLPVVYLNEKLPANAVYVDDFGGARVMTRHLLSQGWRRIAFSTLEAGDHYSIADRIAGYSEAMREAGLKPRVLAADSRSGGSEIEGWLQSRSRPDAFFCASDFHALYCQRFLHQQGLHFPDDIGLAGYNGDGYDLVLESPLTTMRIPRYEMGRAAVEMLVGLITSPRQEPAKSVVFSATLIAALSSQKGASHRDRPKAAARWPHSLV